MATLNGLKIKIGKSLASSNLHKAQYTNTRQNVKSIVTSGYEFKNDCLVWIDKERNEDRAVKQLYRMEEIIMDAGLGYHCSLDEAKMCIWLSEESGE